VDGYDKVREAVRKELEAKKNETLRNQEMLRIAELYKNKIIYWPAVQDFRGRIYRIGHLNIQLDKWARSLTSFYSDKSFVNRKKNQYTMAKFNLLLKEVLIEKDLIQKWDNIFGDRFINNERFEQLLLEDLLAKKVRFIQVSQLLLIRRGAFDRVGVYYDASASAYQIMGVINEDITLCQLTNVLDKDGTRQDMYAFFLEQVKSNIEQYTVYSKDKNILAMYNNYLRDNVNRQLIKAIVMPLIYGKTIKAFAEDLKEFFAEGHLYPSDSALIKLAAQMIKTLKDDPIFTKVGVFMKGLRAIAGLLFRLNKLTIRGAYGDTDIVYYKEEKEQICLYYKQNGQKYKSQKINLSRPIRDVQGHLIRSKTKAVNAFVANYIHFLDASACHYVIEKLKIKNTLNLGTIHDSFFIKPDSLNSLKNAYKEGLIKTHKIHIYNMVCWLYDIQGAKEPNRSNVEAIIKKMRLLAVGNEKPEAENAHNLQQISWNNILKSLEPIKTESKNPDLIKYLELEQPESCLKMEKLLNTNCGQLLFSAN
jgi:DNA-dependent RNA polymerase